MSIKPEENIKSRLCKCYSVPLLKFVMYSVVSDSHFDAQTPHVAAAQWVFKWDYCVLRPSLDWCRPGRRPAGHLMKVKVEGSFVEAAA